MKVEGVILDFATSYGYVETPGWYELSVARVEFTVGVDHAVEYVVPDARLLYEGT